MTTRTARNLVAFLVGLLLALAFVPLLSGQERPAASTDTTVEITPVQGFIVVVRNDSRFIAKVYLVREAASPKLLDQIPPHTSRTFHVKKPPMRAGGEFATCAFDLLAGPKLVGEPVKLWEGAVLVCGLPPNITTPPDIHPERMRSTEDA